MSNYTREQWLSEKGREYQKDYLQDQLDENALKAEQEKSKQDEEQFELDRAFEKKQDAMDIIEEQEQKWGER